MNHISLSNYFCSASSWRQPRVTCTDESTYNATEHRMTPALPWMQLSKITSHFCCSPENTSAQLQKQNTLTFKLKNGLGRGWEGGGKVKLGLKRMGQVHFKQLVLPQVVSKLTWPRLHLFSQEIPGKAWFDTESEPCPTLLPCPQIRKIMDIMSGNREALLCKCKKYP